MQSLEMLHLVDTNIGWEALATVLFDTSNINANRESNHTLNTIECYPLSLPPNINELLEKNISGTASEVFLLKNYSTMTK